MPKGRRLTKAADEEGLVVTAQQSRFHVDASDTPSSKEVCCISRSKYSYTASTIDKSLIRLLMFCVNRSMLKI